MNARYLTAVWPEPFTILGKRLLPLSIGRLLLLQRYECYPPKSPSGLILAVIICSRPCDQVEAAITDRWLRVKSWLWRLRLGKIDWEARLQLFSDYVIAHSRRPSLYESRGHDVLPGAPWLQHLQVCLRARVGWTKQEVAEACYSQALWDYYTQWEVEQRVLIQPEEAKEGAALSEAQVKAMVADADARHEERLAKARAQAGLGVPHGL